MGDVLIDGAIQFGHAGEDAAADALLGDVAEEALDHVQPRRGGGREVHDEARMPGQPLLHVGMLVRGVVVDDQVQRLVPWASRGRSGAGTSATRRGGAAAGTIAITLPSSMFSAANSVVVPWRL